MTRRRHRNDPKPKRSANLWARATHLAMEKLKIKKFVPLKKGTKLYQLTKTIFEGLKKSVNKK